MIEAILGVLIGFAAGVWGYRYALKRDPEAIEKLAAQARRLGNKL